MGYKMIIKFRVVNKKILGILDQQMGCIKIKNTHHKKTRRITNVELIIVLVRKCPKKIPSINGILPKCLNPVENNGSGTNVKNLILR